MSGREAEKGAPTEKRARALRSVFKLYLVHQCKVKYSNAVEYCPRYPMQLCCAKAHDPGAAEEAQRHQDGRQYAAARSENEEVGEAETARSSGGRPGRPERAPLNHSHLTTFSGHSRLLTMPPITIKMHSSENLVHYSGQWQRQGSAASVSGRSTYGHDAESKKHH